MGHSSFTTTQRCFRIRAERLATEYFAAMEFINAEVIMVARSAASAAGGELPLTAHERGMMFGKNQPDRLNEKGISLATPSPGYLLHVPSKPK
jgi:hypothetical protein